MLEEMRVVWMEPEIKENIRKWDRIDKLTKKGKVYCSEEINFFDNKYNYIK